MRMHKTVLSTTLKLVTKTLKQKVARYYLILNFLFSTVQASNDHFFFLLSKTWSRGNIHLTDCYFDGKIIVITILFLPVPYPKSVQYKSRFLVPRAGYEGTACRVSCTSCLVSGRSIGIPSEESSVLRQPARTLANTSGTHLRHWKR